MGENQIIQEFKENSQKEYESEFQLDKFAIIKKVTTTDGTFTKIGIRPQLDKDIFDPNASCYRGVIGLERSITLGEKKYFVENLIRFTKAEEIATESFNEELLKQFVSGLNSKEIILLLPLDLKTKLLMERKLNYDYSLNCFVYSFGKNKIKVFSFLPEEIGNSIIAYDKNKVSVTYKSFGENKLNISIERKMLKYDVILEVLLKQEFLSRDIRRIVVV